MSKGFQASNRHFSRSFASTGDGKSPRTAGGSFTSRARDRLFASLGLPAPGTTATFVATFEFVGGVLLAVGLLSRIAALGLVIDMTTAYITADREAFLSFFADPGKFYSADPFIFLFVGLLILILGPGKLSVDALVQRFAARPTGREASMAAI